MNDLRSLEGVGHLLSQKMAQNNKQNDKPLHKRSISVPKMANSSTATPSTNTIAISANFPPSLAAALANGIQVGYYQNMPLNQPNLLKSHSGFVSQDIPSNQNGSINGIAPPSLATLSDPDNNNNNKPNRGSVTFQNVISPNSQQSMSPPLSPTTWEKIKLDNHWSGNSGNQSNHAFNSTSFTGLPSSPSLRLGSIRGVSSLQLDLSEILLESDTQTPKMPNFDNDGLPQLHHNKTMSMPPISSPDAMEYDKSMDNNNNNNNKLLSSPELAPIQQPPFPLKMTLSNRSLFALHSSSNEELVASNTMLNAVVPADIPIFTENEHHIKDIDIMNLKEDFMEYQQQQKDAFNNIGNGASGIVRKAFHFRSCKMVAIKRCRSKQKDEMAAFVKEAKLYEEFEDNANIINILGFGKDKENGNLAMAMEYMDLGSCDKLNIFHNKILTMNIKELAVGHIILNTLNALKTIHQYLYIHNDIKPHNILSNKYGEIKLSDFGTVLKLKHKNHRLSKNNGTQRYQSPEKMIKQPISYNTKTDIWSIGVTAYELLFGDTYNIQDDLAFINNTPKLTPKRHKISALCCDFITKCLTKDDDKRPSSEQLLKHKWFTQHIKKKELPDKWPWLTPFALTLIKEEKENKHEEKQNDIMAAIDSIDKNKDNKDNKKNGKKKGKKKHCKKVAFAPVDREKKKKKNVAKSTKIKPKIEDNDKYNKYNKKEHEYYNEDLLFMISALIIYYSTQTVDLDNSNNNNSQMLHRRQSQYNGDNKSGKIYSDEERIENMAKYALCSKEMVLDRIRATVNFIKTQINKTEKL